MCEYLSCISSILRPQQSDKGGTVCVGEYAQRCYCEIQHKIEDRYCWMRWLWPSRDAFCTSACEYGGEWVIRHTLPSHVAVRYSTLVSRCFPRSHSLTPTGDATLPTRLVHCCAPFPLTTNRGPHQLYNQLTTPTPCTIVRYARCQITRSSSAPERGTGLRTGQ